MKTQQGNNGKNDRGHFVAGAGAGAITKTMTAPLERIKILFQVQDMRNLKSAFPKYGRSIFTCIRVIYTEEGLPGFFRGNLANVVRVIPMYSIKFAINDKIKNAFISKGKKSLSFGQLIVSGTLAGLTQISCTYPLEVLRTRMALTTSYVAREGRLLKAFADIIKNEGCLAFYKGFSTCILTGTPCIAMQLAIYDHLKSSFPHVGDTTKSRQILRGMLFGSVSGVISQTLTYWGDTVKRRMQSNGIGGQPKIYKGGIDCARKILATEGFVGFYRGCVANTLRSVPGAAIQLTAYDQLKKMMRTEAK